MNRLFINLYVVIVCGLFAINFVSEQIWLLYVNDNNDILEKQRFIELIPKVISPSQKDIQLVSASLNAPVTVLPLSDVAWLNEQRNQLLLGRAVVQFDEQENAVFYVKILNEYRMYQIGPFVNNQNLLNNSFVKWSILGFSYLLLAGIIAIWIRPLWRDLNQLNMMAASIADGEHEVKLHMHSASPINHVVITFHQMSHRIKRLLDDQKHLVNAVSHELRTPLSRLKFALAILPASSDENNSKAIGEMNEDIKEVETLVDEMLGYARLENVNQSIDKVPINLSELVNEQLNKLVFTKPISITKNISSSIMVTCNQKLIERAVQNILINALRYANSHIRLSLVIESKTLLLSIEEDGIGIADSEVDKVFEPFYRLASQANNSQSSSGAGVGLGLAIVKRICDWHFAVCKVEKSSLGGCKFILCFPYK